MKMYSKIRSKLVPKVFKKTETRNDAPSEPYVPEQVYSMDDEGEFNMDDEAVKN